MVKHALLCALLLALPASAFGAGLNLAWNDCGPAGNYNKTFACNTNSADHEMIVSFDPPTVIPDANGIQCILDLRSVSSTLPSWWQFVNAGSCRMASLTARTDPRSCVDTWQGHGMPSIAAYQVTANNPSLPTNRARIVSAVALPASQTAAVEPGIEYFGIGIRINSAKTVGAGACGGCDVPLCIILSELIITAPGSVWAITNPLNSHFVTWQGGLESAIELNGYGCPGGSPAVNRTWGMIKSIYR